MPAFWTLRAAFSPTFASLERLEDVPDEVPLSKLRRGELVELDLGRARFTRSTTPFQFGPSGKKTPAGSQPVDLFRNRQPGCFVVSPRLAASLGALDPALRFASVKLVGVKQMDSASIVLGPCVDALDLKKSRARTESSFGVPDEIVSARALVLDEAKVPPSRSVFRVPLLDTVWFVRDALKAKLESSFVGLELEDPAGISIGG